MTAMAFRDVGSIAVVTLWTRRSRDSRSPRPLVICRIACRDRHSVRTRTELREHRGTTDDRKKGLDSHRRLRVTIVGVRIVHVTSRARSAAGTAYQSWSSAGNNLRSTRTGTLLAVS